MIKNLYLLVFLALLLLYIIYNRYEQLNFKEGYRNAKVYIGESPIPRNNILFMNNDDTFGWHSIYEAGKIRNPQEQSNNNNNIYNSSYSDVYEDSYASYYNYS